jgi:hypothetical protein
MCAAILGCTLSDLGDTDDESIASLIQLPRTSDLYSEKGNVREIFNCSLLLKYVDIEYQGFRSTEQWKKLYWRLRKCHEPYSKELAMPTMIHDLIFQCKVLVQCCSKFRLAFIGGLGRQFAVVHSLLGIDPNSSYLPLDPPSIATTIPPFCFEVVGSTNEKVDVIDLGLKKFDKFHRHHIIKLSNDIQRREQSLTKTDITVFMIRWCEREEHSKSEYIENLVHPDLLTTTYTRVQRWYTKPKFTAFENLVPFRAIDFLCQEIIDQTHEDAKFLLEEVNRLIHKKGGPKLPLLDSKTKEPLPDKLQPQIPEATLNSSLNVKAAWFSACMKFEYSNGFITRSTNVFGGDLHVLVFLMSHGAYWLPKRKVTGTLMLFFQNKGEGTFRWDSSKFLIPNPDSMATPASVLALASSQPQVSSDSMKYLTIKDNAIYTILTMPIYYSLLHATEGRRTKSLH